jgi:hypothetical protein
LDEHQLISFFAFKVNEVEVDWGVVVLKLHDVLISDSKLTAVCDNTFRRGGTAAGSNGFECPEDIKALNDFAEYDVLSIEPGGPFEGYLELRSVGVWSGIGH